MRRHALSAKLAHRCRHRHERVLRRMQFGRSSERITRRLEQLEPRLEEVEAGEAEVAKVDSAATKPPIREKPIRSASRCPITCRAWRLRISRPAMVPILAPIAGRAWRAWVKT